MKRSPEKRSPAPRANAENRANSKSVRRTTDSTKPIGPPDFASSYIAHRYRLSMPVAALVARLAELGRAMS